MRMGCLPLASAQLGQDLRIRSVKTYEACHTQRLRELGLLEGRTVRLLSNHDPMICQVGECRFGLCRRIANGVLVEPLAPLHSRIA
ncbi:MAG: ferrous iron transport protein A [Phycisphaerae bacterium]|nr:ferrous iron transport protein A [Phycisphaerae bacterium]